MTVTNGSAAAIMQGATAMKADLLGGQRRLEAESATSISQTEQWILILAAGGTLLGAILAFLLGTGISCRKHSVRTAAGPLRRPDRRAGSCRANSTAGVRRAGGRDALRCGPERQPTRLAGRCRSSWRFMPPAELCRVGSFSPDFSLTGVWSVRHSSFCASAFNSGEQEDGS